MTFVKSLLLAAALALSPFIAAAQSPPPLGKPVFCNGTYALCIKALCQPVVGPNQTVRYANCSCDVRQGWSMGPGSCQSRVPVVRNARTFLVSTYSNLYNETNKTMSCGNSNQLWAWCYGAPCVVDRANPNKTTCTCPVYTGAMNTLGGECGNDGNDGCNSLWSAAAPKADAAANGLFAAYMKKNGYPHFGPAAMCPASPAK